MRLLDVRFNDDYNYGPFVDEFDRFDEFDIEVIAQDYIHRKESKNNMKNIDETK